MRFGISPNVSKVAAVRRHPAAWLAGLLTLFLAVMLPPAADAKVDGVDRLHAYLRGLNTLSSDFEQVTLAADGGRMVESRGVFYLKRPGKFRWEYQTPVKQVIVADGSRVWMHDLELDQISNKNEDSALRGTPAQLLAGTAPIESQFKVLPWNGRDGREWVELQPRNHDTQVTKIRIGFVGNRLDTLLMEDSFGQLTRFTFTDTKRNPPLPDNLFHLKLPPGGNFLDF
jgi:outer membrane lipoprotein carrier protein